MAKRRPARLTAGLAPASPWTDLMESQPDAGASSQQSLIVTVLTQPSRFPAEGPVSATLYNVFSKSKK